MTGTATDSGALVSLLELLRRRVGLEFPPHRHRQVLDAAMREAARLRSGRLESYLAAISSDAEAFDDLVARLTVGETYFFREPDQFAFVAETVLPDVLARRGDRHVLRAWSAGCASGEEAWSLAMLLETRALGRRYHVLGTDVSREALARALQGVYRRWSLRGSGATQAVSFLKRRGGLYVIPDTLREHVTFEYLNLAGDAYPSFANGTWGCDLIFCRNVLIYFDAGATARVARGLHDSLAEGGWLITASTDPPMATLAGFHAVSTPQGVFYRRPIPGEEPATLPIRPWAPPEPEPVERWAEGPSAMESWLADPPETPGLRLPERAAPPPAPEDPLREAHDAYRAGDYARTLRLLDAAGHGLEACVLRVRALANTGDPSAAEAMAREETQHHPADAELQYLHGAVLFGIGNHQEAVQAVRRALYLAPDLAAAQFMLGSLLQTRGETAGAVRAFRAALRIAAGRPEDESLPLADGERAGALREAAEQQIAILERR